MRHHYQPTTAPLEPWRGPRSLLQNFHPSLHLHPLLIKPVSSSTSVSKILIFNFLISLCCLVASMKIPIIFVGFLWKRKTTTVCTGEGGGSLAWAPLTIMTLLHKNAFWVPHKWLTNELSEYNPCQWGDCLCKLFENHCSSIPSRIKKSATSQVNKSFSSLNNFAASICLL